MIIEVIDGITVLSPEEGYKYVTNGESYTTRAWLGKLDSPDNWHDTNDEPGEATTEDYDTELRRLGVDV